MTKFLQKFSISLLALTVLFFSFANPSTVRATDPEEPQSLNLICGTADAIQDIIIAFNLDWLINVDEPDPWYNPGLCTFYGRVFGTPDAEIADDQLFGERYTFAQINWITHSLLIQTLGRMESLTPLRLFRLFSSNTEPTFQDFMAFGPTGFLMGSISEMVSNPPASGIDSVQSTLAKFDLASPVQAQEGFGYRSTSFLRPLWTASRNMAYAIMIILLIASGFLIMFRVKINPQTAVTLQLMIPRIIITLLAVTFSYAIAGFMIDLVYLLLSIFIFLLGSTNPALSSDPGASISYFLTPGFGKIFVYYTTIWNTIGWAILIPILGPLFGIILTIVILFLLFKVWWMMLKTFLTLMFLIIIGPWQIMLGILPGQSGFSTWLRNVIAHVSVFAVVPIMFIFNMIFWDNNGLIQTIISDLQNLLTAGALGNPSINAPASAGTLPNFPLFGTSGFMFNFALGFAVLALIPKTADMIRDALKAPAFKYGTAIGEAIGPARTIGGGAANLGLGTYTDYASRRVGRFQGGFSDPNMENYQRVLYGLGYGIDLLRKRGRV